ncbi:hypothetical protein [Thermoactinomyces sp. CICC 10520]|jgi:hypothetical protein|uniref:hypothetical protein n=1 Tax=Thermoactinomyces sp. CICC 10520 TaxID=2767433 RepID=UPI0018DECD53|nr:hypothetical protein [Thermoactinomyces sp. CICC 10520]MBH8587094.1 hypothetical protein [Thermoactinomyces sp. CICC 10520]
MVRKHSERYNQNLKKNIIILSRKLNIEISEDIGPLIDKLLKQGFIEKQDLMNLNK